MRDLVEHGLILRGLACDRTNGFGLDKSLRGGRRHGEFFLLFLFQGHGLAEVRVRHGPLGFEALLGVLKTGLGAGVE